MLMTSWALAWLAAAAKNWAGRVVLMAVGFIDSALMETIELVEAQPSGWIGNARLLRWNKSARKRKYHSLEICYPFFDLVFPDRRLVLPFASDFISKACTLCAKSTGSKLSELGVSQPPVDQPGAQYTERDNRA